MNYMGICFSGLSQFAVLFSHKSHYFAYSIIYLKTKSDCQTRKINKKNTNRFISHQANIRIIESTIERAKIPIEKTYINIDKYGNMSSATIPIAIDELNDNGKLKKGNLILVDAFGAGFTWGAAIIRW